jgi:hypothetical protein
MLDAIDNFITWVNRPLEWLGNKINAFQKHPVIVWTRYVISAILFVGFVWLCFHIPAAQAWVNSAPHKEQVWWFCLALILLDFDYLWFFIIILCLT